MREIVLIYLQRIVHDDQGSPARLYPFTGLEIVDAPRSVFIDPRGQFRRPCLAATGIPTTVISERYKAGDRISAIAADCGVAADDVEEAIRYELRPAA